MKKTNKNRREWRNFGLLVGGIFLLIGLWPAIFRGGEPRIWASGVGCALMGLGALIPQSLKPIYLVWMKVGHLLSWVNTRILLGVIFYGLITPMGIIMRLLGKGQMDLAHSGHLDTYRVMRKPRSKDHMNYQF